jgi:hypothetical protein
VNKTKLILETLNASQSKEECGEGVPCGGGMWLKKLREIGGGRVVVDPTIGECVQLEFDWNFKDGGVNGSYYRRFIEANITKKGLREKKKELENKIKGLNANIKKQTDNITNLNK